VDGQRLLAALALGDAELHPLAGLERGEAGRERRGVDEDVAAVVLREEAEALLGVVPLDLAGRHGRPRSWVSVWSPAEGIWHSLMPYGPVP
jgi:hypothetical protein